MLKLAQDLLGGLGFLIDSSMNNDLISIILNTYNSERFIGETIQSVLDQTYTNFELLVIDDGSQDQTLKIISQIQDDCLQVHAYPNGGIATSRNRGLAHASGEYIAYLDHDDLWTPQKLEHQWQCLQASPEASFVYSWVIMINEGGRLIRHLAPVQYTGNIYLKILAQNFVMTASNPLIRRTSLIEIGGFDEEIYGTDDWDLFIRLAKDHPVVLSPYYDLLYRVVAGSGSAKIVQMEKGCLQVIEKAFADTPPHFDRIKKRSLGVNYQYFCIRTLQEPENRRSVMTALQYLKISAQYAPELWKGIVPKLKIYLRMVLILILPIPWARQCMAILARMTHEI